eukprot:8485386-Alexandrium_andersonii.AAC.1
MSASLVGSEMCIRDRLPDGEAVQGGRGPGQQPPGGPGCRALGRQPVSYTHLTLPTIVCRSRWS